MSDVIYQDEDGSECLCSFCEGLRERDRYKTALEVVAKVTCDPHENPYEKLLDLKTLAQNALTLSDRYLSLVSALPEIKERNQNLVQQ